MTLGKCLKGQPNVNTPLGSIRIFTSCGLVQCLHLLQLHAGVEFKVALLDVRLALRGAH